VYRKSASDALIATTNTTTTIFPTTSSTSTTSAIPTATKHVLRCWDTMPKLTMWGVKGVTPVSERESWGAWSAGKSPEDEWQDLWWGRSLTPPLPQLPFPDGHPCPPCDSHCHMHGSWAPMSIPHRPPLAPLHVHWRILGSKLARRGMTIRMSLPTMCFKQRVS
jgi:hypothetical protein